MIDIIGVFTGICCDVRLLQANHLKGPSCSLTLGQPLRKARSKTRGSALSRSQQTSCIDPGLYWVRVSLKGKIPFISQKIPAIFTAFFAACCDVYILS
jgi:hypothetical protein